MVSIWMLTRALLAFTKNWASHYLRGTRAQSRRPCSYRCDPFNRVALDNLVDLIVTCLTHPAVANQTFLVSDGEDLSTIQLLRRMGAALGKLARLIPVPASVLKLGAAFVGKPELAQRLCGSLQVDISKTKELRDWRPPVSVDEGLKRVAEGYLRETTV